MVETKSNRPKNHPLFQQRLRAWKPRLTFKDASIFFFVSGVVVLVIGIAIFVCDQNVQEYLINYTDCKSVTNPTQSCSSISNLYNTSCSCSKDIEIKTDMKAPVYFYYAMVNFYQNHRQLIKSYDAKQLMGFSAGADQRACLPVVNDSMGRFYAPCGQMANVIFNDTFVLINKATNNNVSWTSSNIALYSDKRRFAKQKGGFNNSAPPPNWRKPITDRFPNAYEDAEELMVWMRPAALPRFRKLHRIFTEIIKAGNYTMMIDYNYPVTSFSGEKYFIITELSWIGGKNGALGILYLTTGCVEIVIGIVLTVLSMKYPLSQVKDNNMILSSKL